MSELNNYDKLIPYSLEEKILTTTRRMVYHLSKFDALGSIEHNGNADEVDDAIREDLQDFMGYLGTTCGDTATHHWGHNYSKQIAELASLSDINEQIAMAIHLLGTDADKVTISEKLKAWLDHMMGYANACKNNTNGHSTFKLDENGRHPFPAMRTLLEERCDLYLEEESDGGLYYKAFDGRGAEYGDWVFVPKQITHLGLTCGIPNKLDDGTYEKYGNGKIKYFNRKTYEYKEDVIEVTKYITDPDEVVSFDIPTDSFYQFYREIANQ